MDEMTPDDHFTLREDLVVEEVDDEIVVLDLDGNQYFGLNEVAWLIWQAIDEQKSLAQIVEEIASEFEIDEDRARDDTMAFIEQLLEAGLASRSQSEST